MENERLSALEKRVADLKQEAESQQQGLNECTKNLVSDMRTSLKYFDLLMCELITMIRILRGEI